VINTIRGPLAGVLPEVSTKLGEVGDSLNDLVMESEELQALLGMLCPQEKSLKRYSQMQTS